MSNGLPDKPTSLPKIFAVILGVFAILVIAAFLCVPLFFSTALGKKLLIEKIESSTGCRLQIDTLSLSWMGQQQANGIRMQKPQEGLELACEELSSDAPLWRILFIKDVGHVMLKSPSLQLSKAFQPTAARMRAKFQAAGFAATPDLQLALPRIELSCSGQVNISQGKVSITNPGIEPIHFDNIEMLLALQKNEEVALNLSCQTRQQQNAGQIAVKGIAKQLSSTFPDIAADATLSHLPVQGIDQLATLFSPSLNGLIYSAVGPSVDLQGRFAAAHGNFDLSLNVQSAQLTIQIATQTQEGMVSLKNPAQLNFNLTPDLFQKLGQLHPSLSALALTQPAQIQAKLTRFSSPLPSTQADLLKSSFQASVDISSPLALSVKNQPVSFNDLHMSAQSDALDRAVAFTLSSGLQMQNQSGSLSCEGTVTAPFSQAPQGSIAINAAALPVDLIGIAAGATTSLATWVGPTVDLQGSLNLEGNSPRFHLSWKSRFLNIPSFDLSLGNSWELISPVSFAFALNPQLLSQAGLQLTKAAPFQGTLQSVQIPTDRLQNCRLQATLKTGHLAWGGTFPLEISSVNAQLNINTLDQISVQLDGQPLSAFISGAWKAATAEFVLNKPLNAQCILDDKTLKAWVPTAPTLVKPALFQLVIDPTTLPLSALDFRTFSFKGQLSIPEVTLGAEATTVTLKNSSMPFEWNGTKAASLQFTSSVQNPSGEAGSMQGQFSLANFSTAQGWALTSAAIQGSLDLQNLSTALLEALSGKKNISAIAGPTFSGKFKLQSTAEKQNLAVKWTSPLLTIDSAFVIEGALLKLQGGANQVNWTLTPESYAILDSMITGPTKGMVPFAISDPSTFSLTLSKLSLPVAAPTQVTSLAQRIPAINWDLAQLELNLSGRNPKLAFIDMRSKESIQLANLTFSLSHSSSGEPLMLALDCGVITQSTSSTIKNGSLSLSGKLAPTLNAQGAFDLSQLTGNLQLKASQLPSRALDLIARAKGRTDFPFTTIFGDMINASINTDLKGLTGPLSVNINTPMVRIDLDGHLVNGALMLNNALYAQMKLTTELSRLILKEVNPLNLSYIYSQAPVTLEVPAQGFYLPLYPFTVGKIAIPDATIELGKIACRNEGNVNVALGLLKTKQFDKSGELMLWFAPIDLSVKQGFVDIERTEILLADTFDICVWGNIDLVKDYVDMVLGLTAQTLSKAFGIKNLPENYVLTLPMKGPANNVQIDTSKATAKMALLFAWQKNIAGAIGGPAGALVGGLLGKMATLPDFDAKVPPPKHPFPWEINQNSKTSHKKRRQFKGTEKPLKQIWKVIR